MTTPRVSIDRTKCMGAGMCAFIAHDTFELDDDSISTVIDPEGDPVDRIEAAARECPTGAIEVRRSG